MRALAHLGKVIAPSRAEMDLADVRSTRLFLRQTKPRWIVNAGAYTAVDKAENEPELAYAINAEAVKAIGSEAAAIGATVLHYSTDYVFNGSGATPWLESDAPDPLGVYGASKLAGEQTLLDSGANAFIFRTSWVYGATGKNFVRTILKLARERKELRIVNDQYGAPTWSRDLARMASHVIGQLAQSPERERDLPVIYHAAGAGETTWARFAEEAIRLAKLREPRVEFARIIGIPSVEYPTPAARPHNSRLNCQRLSVELGWKMMDWRDSLSLVIAELGSNS